ncbi:unnamed protein product [Caenorhabditis auriculariae]|uniref:Fibronectin type-III domain-containing protein n=1 Tax=Caenorhabditis auriculariae TaxID=2777116 RepID=A0A8S1GQQ8_9PELO|nr:unnamed protein product [Caenorhabditis auriculariae]
MASYTCVRTAPPPRISSPFSPSTSACLQDSDCGSSSGPGGMKAPGASDEGGSSSGSRPTPFNNSQRPIPLQNNNYAMLPTMPRPPIPPLMAPMAMHSGPPPQYVQHQQVMMAPPPMGMIPAPLQAGPMAMGWISQTPPVSQNDLYVHVQNGEAVGVSSPNELQKVFGPASIRMVTESLIPPTALPINVPPGHQVHQFIDEQGCLRHVILSLETPPSSRHGSASLNYVQCETGLMQPMSNRFIAPPQQPPPIRKLPQGVVPIAQPMHAYTQPPIYPQTPRSNWKNQKIRRQGQTTGQEESEPEDSEENEKIREMLNRIVVPQIPLISATEAEVQWQHIDTSEAAAPGGPFPQIDSSEFIYHVVLFESTGRFVATSKYDTSMGNNLRMCSLRPNTEYIVKLKVSLDERGLMGETTQVRFKTAPGRPEPPMTPTLLTRGLDSLKLSWRAANDNGCIIHCYYVYLSLTFKEEIPPKVYQTERPEILIDELSPETSYRIRITAVNALGESGESSPLTVVTRCEDAPIQPEPIPPTIVQTSQRSVKVAWNGQTESSSAGMQLEMYDVQNKTTVLIKERLIGPPIHISDLQPGCEYRFRVFSRGEDEESPRSSWVTTRTLTQRSFHGPHRNAKPEQMHEFPCIPSRPYPQGTDRRMEICWQYGGPRDRDLLFHLEGSTFNHPHNYRTLYRGSATTYLLTEENIQNFRVQSISKNNLPSPFSEVLTLPRKDDDFILQPGKLTPPRLENFSLSSVKVTWNPLKDAELAKSEVVYEAKRLDVDTDCIYIGKSTEWEIKEVEASEVVTVQVRAVFITGDQKKVEGDWSESTTIVTPPKKPDQPKNVHFNPETSVLSWICELSNGEGHFNVDVTCKALEKSETSSLIVTENFLTLPKLVPAAEYTCTVVAVRGSHESEESESIKFNTPSVHPSQPNAVCIDSESVDSLLLNWTAADCRGTPIKQYRVKVINGKEIIREAAIIANEGAGEFTITNLEPNTQYRVEICAENEIGMGPAVSISGRTKSPPPAPPKIDCEPEVNMMRLRWKPTTSGDSAVYKLVRLSNTDAHIPVYEGALLTTKVKGLAEDTEYRFQIRASNKLTGVSVWSQPYSFRTNIAPPPLVRRAPVCTPIADQEGHCLVEWSNVLPQPNTRNQFYRLQVINSKKADSRWHTVFEGCTSSFVLPTAEYTDTIHLRVFCVRRGDDGEVKSGESPHGHFTNRPRDQNNSDGGAAEVDQRPWYVRYNNRLLPIVVIGLLVIFALFTLGVAVLCDWLFNLGQAPDTPSPYLIAMQASSSAPRGVIHPPSSLREL